uniref:D-aminoacyl-tRNA deacylase n=1 Tax=Dermatophagoides pteronyssinus TaxID=6956 RepID=A0A6P6YB63_DERPT|nr:uncharacterized protein LOC113796172 [Dermatophagoides pteronyssinus]
MKIVIQRVISAEFISKNELVSKIGNGIYVLVGAEQGDTMEDVDYVAKKILNCKFFNDSELGFPDDSSHRWKKSVKERGLEILIATNFTLPSSLKKGTKPSLCLALDPEQARYYEIKVPGLD